MEKRFKEIARTSLQGRIVEQIEELVENGELKHGDRLPPERKLAELFKVSRHSVREAIRTLEEKGVLKSKPGSGTFVILEDRSAVMEFIARSISEEKSDQAEVFQFRRLLEPQIAGLAALNADEDEIRGLEELLEKQMNAGFDLKAVRGLDKAFHMALAKAAGNRILLKVSELLTEIIDISRLDMVIDETRFAISIKGHGEILDALRNHDRRLAEKAMAKHIDDIEQKVTETKGRD